MLKLRYAFAAAIALCVSMAAQDRARFEVFGGYSLERIAPCGVVGSSQIPCGAETGFLAPTTNFNGWDAAFTGYFTKFLGATADFSGHYGSYNNANFTPNTSVSRYSYMFGPVFAWRSPRLTPFAHFLLGGTSESVGGSSIGDYNVFSWAVGGGLDVTVSKRVAVRFADLDYESVHVPHNSGANGLRYSGGVVFRF